MIKVELDPVFDDYDDFRQSTRYKEMKAWCRETFGKNPIRGPKIWCINYSMEYIYCQPDEYDPTLDFSEWVYYPAFYFTDPTHANWFKLKWA